MQRWWRRWLVLGGLVLVVSVACGPAPWPKNATLDGELAGMTICVWPGEEAFVEPLQAAGLKVVTCDYDKESDRYNYDLQLKPVEAAPEGYVDVVIGWPDLKDESVVETGTRSDGDREYRIERFDYSYTLGVDVDDGASPSEQVSSWLQDDRGKLRIGRAIHQRQLELAKLLAVKKVPQASGPLAAVPVCVLSGNEDRTIRDVVREAGLTDDCSLQGVTIAAHGGRNPNHPSGHGFIITMRLGNSVFGDDFGISREMDERLARALTIRTLNQYLHSPKALQFVSEHPEVAVPVPATVPRASGAMSRAPVCVQREYGSTPRDLAVVRQVLRDAGLVETKGADSSYCDPSQKVRIDVGSDTIGISGTLEEGMKFVEVRGVAKNQSLDDDPETTVRHRAMRALAAYFASEEALAYLERHPEAATGTATAVAASGVSAPRPVPSGPIWPSVSAPVGGLDGSKDAAVVVAIGDYAYLADIEGAVKSGQDWYGYFAKSLKIPSDRLFLVTNENATSERIREVAEQAAGKAKAGGRVWFVYIGHGAPDEAKDDGLLVAADAQQTVNGIANRSVAQSRLLGILAKSNATPVAIIDACYSGKQSSGAPLLVEGGLMPSKVIKPTIPAKALVLMAASNAQFAGALPGAKRPAFSYLVLGALRGWADDDHDGTVTAGEAIGYASGTLQAALQGSRSQTPQLSGNNQLSLGTAKEKGPELANIIIRLAAP